MRIKQQTTKRKRKPYEWWIAIVTLSAFVLFSFFLWSSRQEVEQSYFCDMENLSLNGNKFLSGGHTFSGGKTQSNEKAFAGVYSAKCTKENTYGPGIQIDGLNEGDVIEASVWRQSDDGYGVLTFQGQGKWSFYDYSKEVVSMQKGWEKIQKKRLWKSMANHAHGHTRRLLGESERYRGEISQRVGTVERAAREFRSRDKRYR